MLGRLHEKFLQTHVFRPALAVLKGNLASNLRNHAVGVEKKENAGQQQDQEPFFSKINKEMCFNHKKVPRVSWNSNNSSMNTRTVSVRQENNPNGLTVPLFLMIYPVAVL